MIPLDEAAAQVLGACHPLAPGDLALGDALGCVVAQPLRALEDVPPFVNTAVDGFAVRAVDTDGAPVELEVVGTLPAGAAPSTPVRPGQAIRIMTGAPIPDGADAVVMVEDTDRLVGEDRVRVLRAVSAGDALRHVGDDVHEGDELFPAGTVLRPAMLGVLASVNHRVVRVHPRARVGVLSTGDELVTDGRPLRPGEIRESNKTMLLGAVAQAGCIPVDYGVVADDEAALEAVLRRAAQECHAIVTSGGVSMGDYDVVKSVLSRIADMSWMQIAIKPAKPFAFGMLGGTPVFGLPGNPVSSIVSFELLARPALRRMMGHPDASLGRPRVRAIADDGLPRRVDGKIHYQRVHGAFGDDGRWHVRSSGAQGSHQLAATAAANGLAVVGDGDGVPAGGEVEVLLLDGWA